MNHAPSSSFTFLHPPPPPPPNPNPNFQLSNPISLPPPDLPTTLSLLKHLIHHSQTTVDSISTLLHHRTITTTSLDGLCSCSFNPHHRVPPESLFRHSLQCPSSPASLDLSLIESLHYPNTLQSSDSLINQNRFVQTLHDPHPELCFTLDDYWDNGSNFFYQDCPGVFSLADTDRNKRTFTLPATLSAECANFIGSGDCEIKGVSRECLSLLLPSEFWLVRSEIESWTDYPTFYSYNIVRVISCLPATKEHDFLRWVIVNSPRYGVVIDVAMREHIVLLFRLCLKAITREAEMGVFSREVKELNLSKCPCPSMVEVLRWLSYQLSVLYGEVNGKFFAIDMLKQCLLNASQNASLSPIVQNATNLPDSKEVDHNKLEESLGGKNVLLLNERRNNIEGEGKTLISRVVFVSQVAAAIAALHERFFLEVKIKALRYAQPVSNYQRMAEHADFSKRAEEERQKRCNYRPLLEHDGLLWQRSRNQETNKMKTREELLAEERDYKRRRMSYRGKKLKRTTTQVIRDIIEEYMEEFKQEGGLGCLGKEAEAIRRPEPFSAQDISQDEDLKKTVSNSYEVSKGRLHGVSKQSHSTDIRFSKFKDQSPEDCKRHRRDSHWSHENLESSVSSRDRRDREYYSRSTDEYGSHSRSNDYTCHRDDVEVSRKNFSQSPGRNYSLSRVQSSSNRREQIDQNLQVKDRERSNRIRNKRHAFEDRYDPSESHDYEDGVFSRSKYVGPD